MNKLLVILGPTSTGKTDLALQLAHKFSGELISVDSRQLYKSLDIGTGKIPQLTFTKRHLAKKNRFWEIDGIKVWMYDVVNPEQQYTVADYIKDAKKVIRNIQRRDKLPIVVGGTGLYIKALLYGFSSLSIPVDWKLRKKLEQLSTTQLQEKLKNLSPKKWNSLNHSDGQNPRRLVRAIELELGKGNQVIPDLRSQGLVKEFHILKIGLTTQRKILYERADKSVINRIKAGMISEAKELHKNGLSFKRMRQLGLEYRVLADFLERKIETRDKLLKILQGKIHGYIRRQSTWFKKEKDTNWFDITTSDYLNIIENLVSDWYN